MKKTKHKVQYKDANEKQIKKLYKWVMTLCLSYLQEHPQDNKKK